MLFKIAAFVIPLGFDTLAVAISLGLRGIKPLRPAVTFAVFEAVMPIIGLLLGRAIGVRFETLASIAGGVILLAVAGHVLKEALEDEDEAAGVSFSTMRLAMLAGLGISMDELAVGFPMGTSDLPPAETIGAIALQAFMVTWAGILGGRRLGVALGRRASRLAAFAAASAFTALGFYLIAEALVMRPL